MTGYRFQDETQKGILFLSKTDKDFFIEASILIKSEYFDFDMHRRIYDIIQAYFEKYKKLPPDSAIIEELKCSKDPNESIADYEKELEKINQLTEESIKNKEYLLDLVEKFAKKCSVKFGIINCIDLLEQGNYDEIEEVLKGSLSVSRALDLGKNYDDFEKRWDEYYGQDWSNNKKIPTGFPTIDAVLEGGLSKKELGLIAAPAGVGKSMLLVRQASICMAKGLNVLFISLEMTEELIAARLDTMLTKMPLIDIKANKNEFFNRINRVQNHIKGKLVIKQFPTRQANVNSIKALISQIYSKSDLRFDVLIVDYLELLTPLKEISAEYLAQERTNQELRGLGIEYDILVWTATQTNREGKKVAVISDTELADSYGKIRTVDLGISMNQTETEAENGEARLFVMKSRNSKSRFSVPIKVDYTTLQFTE